MPAPLIGAAALAAARIIASKMAKDAAKQGVKITVKQARAIAREAAGPKNKAMIARKVPKYDVSKAKVTTKTGSSTTITKGTSAKVAPLTRQQIAERTKVIVKRMTAEERELAKQKSKSKFSEPVARREAMRPTTKGVQARRTSKTVPRARTLDQLGKSSSSKIQKKTDIKEQKKIASRINRATRPALIRKNEAAVKRVMIQKAADKKRQSAETKLFNDKTPVVQYDSMGRVIGRTTKGELRQLKVTTTRAAADPRNTLRGGRPQRTIDERSPRPKGLTDKEIEILRKVGKRDYSKGEVNPLAQKIVQSESDRRVGAFYKDPKVIAQDKAREAAAVRKTMSDKALAERAKKVINKKTFRGKAK
jgi:hypothetical protein